MLENSSKNENRTKKLAIPTWAWLIILPVWTYGVFVLVQFILAWIAEGLIAVGVPLASMNQVTFVTIISVLAYGLAVFFVVWLPYNLWGKRTTRKELGVPDLPAWMDIFLSVPAYIVYMIVSSIVMMIAVRTIPGLDVTQAQELPFSQTMLATQWQITLAFVVMVVLAPFAEELLFRGYLYGKLRRFAPAIGAILVTSLAFGAAHLWTGGSGPLQWAVALDTMVLSLMLCTLREYTGAIWAGVLVHAIKNGLAFYLLFINPNVIDQLQAGMLLLL